MDTKLKNMKSNDSNERTLETGNWKFNLLKGLAVLLSVICFTSGIVLLVQTAQSGLKTFRLTECLTEENYLDSSALDEDFTEAASGLEALSSRSVKEQEIREGKGLETSLEEYKLSLLEEDRERFSLWEKELGRLDDESDPSEERDVSDKTVIDVINSDAFLKRHESEIEAKWEELIESELSRYNSLIHAVTILEREKGLQWLYEQDGQIQSSSKQVTEENLKNQKVWGEIDHGQLSGSIRLEHEYVEPIFPDHINLSSRIVFAFEDQSIENLIVLYKADHQQAVKALQYAIGLMMTGILLCLGAILAAGRQPGSSVVVLAPIDRIYWDLHLLISGILISIAASFGGLALMEKLPQWIGVILIAVSIALAEIWLLSFARIIKAGKVKERFGLAVLGHHIWQFFKKVGRDISGYYYRIMKGRPLVYRVLFWGVIGVLSGVLIVIPPFIGIVTSVMLLVYAGKKAKVLDQVIRGVQKLDEGDSDYRIEVSGKGAFEDMGMQINRIHSRMADEVKNAVDRELKSERLKTELITNVSHDIRTPLTSIITYIDLLKQPDTDEASRQDYLEILEKKAARLKALTDDLFEAAKASTGNIEVHSEAVNLEALVDQGMGELADQICDSGLTFIVDRPEEKVMVRADGRLLWRVIENLLSNVLKYAMPQSRVYLVIEKDVASHKGILTVKNISAAPLNLSPEELLERFKRGDESRHNEGSGLGLSIAKDLTKLQEGAFELDIDGDLFKTTVCLELFEEIDETEAVL